MELGVFIFPIDSPFNGEPRNYLEFPNHLIVYQPSFEQIFSSAAGSRLAPSKDLGPGFRRVVDQGPQCRAAPGQGGAGALRLPMVSGFICAIVLRELRSQGYPYSLYISYSMGSQGAT